MTAWTWPECTIAVLAFGGIGYVTHRARGIGERAKRQQWTARIRQANRERGDKG